MPITLSPLPYALDALEPYLSRRAVATHYRQHHTAYVKRARALVAGTPLANLSLEEVVVRSAGLADPRLFQAAAQAWSHDFCWRSMAAGGGGAAAGPMAGLLDQCFGSQAQFVAQFVEAGASHFGSGWAWLVLEGGRLLIMTTADADTPLGSGRVPLVTVDLWEHAYYLDYESRRRDYLAAVMENLVDWEFANQNLRAAAEAPVPSRQGGAIH